MSQSGKTQFKRTGFLKAGTFAAVTALAVGGFGGPLPFVPTTAYAETPTDINNEAAKDPPADEHEAMLDESAFEDDAVDDSRQEDEDAVASDSAVGEPEQNEEPPPANVATSVSDGQAETDDGSVAYDEEDDEEFFDAFCGDDEAYDYFTIEDTHEAEIDHEDAVADRADEQAEPSTVARKPVYADDYAHASVEATVELPLDPKLVNSGTYVYDLESVEGHLVATDEGNAHGGIAFQVAYTEPGTYDYTVVEYREVDGDYEPTGRTTKVTVVVTRGQDGALHTAVSVANRFVYDPAAAPKPEPELKKQAAPAASTTQGTAPVTPAVQAQKADAPAPAPASEPAASTSETSAASDEKPVAPAPAPSSQPASELAPAVAKTEPAEPEAKLQPVSDVAKADSGSESAALPRTADPTAFGAFSTLAAFGATLLAGVGILVARKKD